MYVLYQSKKGIRRRTPAGRCKRKGNSMGQVTTIVSGPLQASIDSKGAELSSLQLNGKEYLWQADPHWWGRHAPVLFPIVGSIRNDQANSQQGPVKLGRHGIARNYDHAIVAKSDDSVTFELASNPETLERFPFNFKLNMTYSVDGQRLTQTFKVTNTGDVVLPYVLGGHPAFNVPTPAEPGADFSDYHLKFSKPWTYSSPTLLHEEGLWDFSRQMPLLQDSDTLNLTHRLFDVDTIVFQNVPDGTVRLEGPQGHGVQLDFPGFEWLGVWSAMNDAPFVAIEPWTSPATALDEDDEFEHKRGMAFLQPGESSEHSFTIMPF